MTLFKKYQRLNIIKYLAQSRGYILIVIWNYEQNLVFFNFSDIITQEAWESKLQISYFSSITFKK